MLFSGKKKYSSKLKLGKIIRWDKDTSKTYLKREFFVNTPTKKEKLKDVLKTEEKWHEMEENAERNKKQQKEYTDSKSKCILTV